MFRSRAARLVSSTTYIMSPASFIEYFPCRPRATVGYIVKPLPDCLMDIGAGSDVEEPLISRGVLDDSGGLAFHSEHNGAVALLEVFHKVPGPTAEHGQRLDILGDVKHRSFIQRTSAKPHPPLCSTRFRS